MSEPKASNTEWHILHIDDDEDDYLIIRSMLLQAKGRKIHLDWASTFEAGRQKLFKGYYDAVLVDYDLGISTGIEIIQEYVARGGMAPLILFTGRGSHEVDLEAMAAGATLYLTKGEVNPLLLERSIRYAIERKQTEDALRHARDEALEKEERLKLAQKAGRVGSYEIDMITQSIIGSDEFEVIHGLQPGDSQRIDWHQLIHPEDVAKIDEEIVRAVREQRREVTGEYRIIRPSGEIRWIENRGAIFYDASNHAVRMTGVSVDITDRKQAEQALGESVAREKERNAEFDAIMDATPAIIWVTRDAESRLVTGNRAAHDFLRVPRPQNLSKSAPSDEAPRNFRVFQNGKELAPEELPLQIAAATGRAIHDFEEEVVFDDGSRAFLLGNATPLVNEDGQACGAVAAFINITPRKLAEEALREGESRFRSFFENRHTPMLLIDPATRLIVDANPAACSFYGWSHDELVTMRITDINHLPPADSSQQMELVAEVRSGKKMIFHHYLASGQIRDVEIQSGPILMGGKEYLFSIINDITDRLKVEEALREAHDRAVWMARFPEENPNPVARISSHGRVLFHNTAAASLEGWALKDGQLVDQPLMELIKRAITSVGEVQQDLQMGEKIYSISVMPFPTEDYVNLYGRDITLRRQAEEALRISEERFNTAFNSSPNAQIISRLEDGKIEVVNDSFEKLFALHREDIIGKTMLDLNLFASEADRQKLISRLLAGESVRNYVIDLRASTGEIRNVSVSMEKITVSGEAALFTVLQDFTERVQAERALRESEERFRTMANNISQMAWIMDEKGRRSWFNQRWIDYTGFSHEEGKNWGWRKTIDPAYRDEVIEKVNSSLQAGTAWEGTYPIRRKDGQYRWFLTRCTPFQDENGRAVRWFGTNTDITELQEIEKALKMSEDRFRLAAQAVEGIVYDWNLETGLVYRSEGIQRLLGVPYEPQPNQNWWPERIHPQDYPLVQQAFQTVLNGTENSYEIEYRIQHTNGDWIDVWDKANILRDESGRAVRVVGFATNITERKQAEAELQHYARELERSNQALQDFTFIASHDLQEPLRKVQTFGQLLETRFASELGTVGLDYIERMRKASERMSTMLSGLLDYSRVTTHVQPFQTVELSPLVNEVLVDLEARIMETGGQVTVDPLPVIQADPLQMRQLFQNLIGNALKYHRPDVPPVVQVSSRSDHDQLVSIAVADNGLGLEMKQAEYIFQPFTRLNSKFIYEGTGVGLAICRKIVERHGGKITVESVPEQGSVFTVVLPVRQPE